MSSSEPAPLLQLTGQCVGPRITPMYYRTELDALRQVGMQWEETQE